MAYGTTKNGDFEDAIKNFSMISLKVDTLSSKGSGDAVEIINKSIEHRNEAIDNEVARRLESLDVEEKSRKIKELSNSNLTLEAMILEEVKEEFDKGVTELKTLMQKGSEEYESADNRDNEDDGSESSEEGSTEGEDEESTDAESADDEDTEDEESSEDESTESEEETDDENTDEGGDATAK